MTVKKIIFTLLFLPCFFAMTFAAVYECVDSQGNPSFTDQWCPGAKVIETTGIQSVSVKNATSGISQSVSVKKATNGQTAEKSVEPSVILVSPIEQDYIHGDDAGTLPIEAKTNVNFEDGYTMQVVLDGQAYGNPANTERFSVTQVFRGMHTLQLELMDKNGNVVAKSGIVNFYMKRNIVVK